MNKHMFDKTYICRVNLQATLECAYRRGKVNEMAAMNLDQFVAEALELLPPVGQMVDFDEYKATLQGTYPDQARDIFTHMLRQNLVGKKLVRNAEGKLTVKLLRKA